MATLLLAEWSLSKPFGNLLGVYRSLGKDNLPGKNLLHPRPPGHTFYTPCHHLFSPLINLLYSFFNFNFPLISVKLLPFSCHTFSIYAGFLYPRSC
jgi:hypothetical protein